MINRHFIVGLSIWLTSLTSFAVHANQDALTRVRELYLSADYEGALTTLDRLEGDTLDQRTELADYRVFCLLALDRGDEARRVIRSIVETDPFHHLEVPASPRMETAFQETRKAVLPDVVQRLYKDARNSFDRHDPGAVQQFDRLMALLDDPDLKDAQLSDLRAVASGFRDLSKAANDALRKPEPIAEARAPEPAPSAAAGGPTKPNGPLTGPPDTIRVTAKGASPLFTAKEPPTPGVEPPFAIAQAVPQWSPRGPAAAQTYTGVIEVTIDENGRVTTVALQQPMQPDFDKALIKAARNWKYKPARLDGTPVAFVKVIQIQIQPER